MKSNKLALWAAVHSLGVVVYVALVVTLISNVESLFSDSMPGILGPIAMLLLFVFSALLTGFLVLGKPLMFYLDGQKKEAVKMLFYTGAWLFSFMALFFIVLALVSIR